MSENLEYSDVFLVTRGALSSGRIKLHKQGIIFKSTKTGKVEQIPMAEIESVFWMRVARGYGLKVVLKTLTEFKFVGFREADYDKLSEFLSKNFSLKLDEIELSVKGWNWGVAKFKGSILSFEVDKKPSFEIPLKDVSAATTGKNEVTVEFHQHDDAQVSLMEMRFFVPITGDVEDPLKDFHDQILAKADVIQATGDAIVTFPEVACLTPRGRYSIKVYPTFIQLHGKTYDYKIPHTTVLRLFLLPHKDQRFMFFVVSMDPPIRQGQTRYPFLILQFEREEEITCKLNVSDDDITAKYNGKLQQDMSGPLFEVVSRVLKEVVGRKITVPGSFKGHSGNSITCSHRAGNGLLYPLERGFIFVHKPPVHVRSDEISCVNFARGGSTGRTFDFDVELKNGTVVNFSNLDRDEYGHLFDFVTSKNLRIRNKGGKTSQPSMMDDLMDSDDDQHDVYLNRVKDEARQRDDDEDDEDSEEDSDFNPENDDDADVKEEFDSNASESESGSDADGEGDEGDEGGSTEKKEKKRKSQSKPKSSAPKRAKKDPSERKKKKNKDKNAPKRGATAYMLWLSDTREQIKTDNPGISMIDIAKKGGELWRQLTSTDKSKWEDLAKKDKERYETEMEEYKKRPKEEKEDSDEQEASTSKKPKKEKKERKETTTTTSSKKSKSVTSSTKVSPGKFKSKEFIDSSDSSSDHEEKPSSKKDKKDKSKGKKEKTKEKKEKSKATKEELTSGDDEADESEAKMTDESGEESAGEESAAEKSAGEESAGGKSAGEKSDSD